MVKKNLAEKKVDKKNINGKTVSDIKVSETKKSHVATEKAIIKKTPVKKTVTKKVTPKKSSSKKLESKNANISSSTKRSKSNSFFEYYDLPYRYNQTVVKILAQTPKTLFIYWDIADEYRKSLIEQYGSDFFANTRPVLVVHNKTKNYTFEVEIDDFANTWYLNISDPKSIYEIELGRRNINKNIISNNYLCITASNDIDVPNDHILFEEEQKTIFFKNTKTNNTYSKDIANLAYIKHLGKAHKLFDFYNKIYDNCDLQNNPTSNFTNC